MSSRTIDDPMPATAFFCRTLVFLVAISLALGISPISSGQALAPLTRPSTALARYVRTPDKHFRFEVTSVRRDLLLTRYTIRMQSQAWNPGGLVLGRRVWEHGIALVAPRLLTTDTGLLLIAGGSNDEELIDGEEVERAARVALLTGAPVAVVFQIPNQPLQFADEPFDHTEDELVAYTWDKAMDTADYRWPVYLPMVKGAVRAMDTVQALLPGIEQFVVTGFSKRGAATWLTAAVDSRVRAIAPGVFDALNFSPQAAHHVKAYGCFAPALEDYNDYRIFQRINTPAGAALRLVVDPYAYLRRPRFRERLNLPKYLVNSSGDQFFVSDAARFYWRNLPGQKHIRYVPNSDHTLGQSAAVSVDSVTGLLAWYRAVLLDIRRPPISWSFDERGSLSIKTASPGASARLWQATNPTARDFRFESIGEAWTSSVLRQRADGAYRVRVPEPTAGWTAYFVEVTFPSAVSQVYSTQVFVTPRSRPFEDVRLARAGPCPR